MTLGLTPPFINVPNSAYEFTSPSLRAVTKESGYIVYKVANTFDYPTFEWLIAAVITINGVFFKVKEAQGPGGSFRPPAVGDFFEILAIPL